MNLHLKKIIFNNSKVIKDIEEFKKISDVIIANRRSETLKDVEDTRDIFGKRIEDISNRNSRIYRKSFSYKAT